MIVDTDGKIASLFIIAGRKMKDGLLNALLDADIHLIDTVYGKGTVKASMLMSTFGLVPEENKVMIVCLSTCEKIDKVLPMLEEKFNFSKPNTGIAFTVHVDNVSY